MPPKQKKVLLAITWDYYGAYKTKLAVAVPKIPNLALATIAAPLMEKGFIVKIFDPNIIEIDPKIAFLKMLNDFHPDYVAISFPSALYSKAKEAFNIVKDFDKNITTVGGGPHTSVEPKKTLEDMKNMDVAIVGEGDYTLLEMAQGKNLKNVKGIAYRKGKRTFTNPTRNLIEDINMLPFPRWDLYDLSKYHSPRISSKKSPIGSVETSRGCAWGCTYCNKGVFFKKWRVKTPKRVVDEMEYMLDIGFKEIRIEDDMFTTDKKRAKQICDEIINRGLKFPWNCGNGIRADSVDLELLKKMKQAGCYSISIGVESGDQKILDNIDKGTTVEKIRTAFSLAKQAKINTVAFFMIGLPGQDEESINTSIKLANEIKPDALKVGITVPLPGTTLYNQVRADGRILNEDWDNYNYNDVTSTYRHDTMDWPIINKYLKIFYRKTLLKPWFIWSRIRKGILSGDLFYDAYYFLKTIRYGW